MEVNELSSVREATNLDYSKYDFKEPEVYVTEFPKGINEKIVEEISRIKNEPQWMTDFRLKAYRHFVSRPLPMWGADLTHIDFDNIRYYIRPTDKQVKSWDELPPAIKDTFDRLGVPEAERKFLAGVGAMYESEVVYHRMREDLEKQGVIFADMDTGLREYPEIVKKYFGTVVPYNDNKFAALNSAVWSGGSFIYVPPGVKVEQPLHAYFRINASNMGQFERTLIIADEGADVHYIEGCTAPVYSSDSLHAAVVELIAMKGAHIRYTTIQNWSKDVYNLVTKRAFAYEDARVEWIDGNMGSKVTMKYPAVHLKGRGARAEVLSIALAGAGQHIDAGSKILHLAPDTSSRIISKSISKDGGRATYRGQLLVAKGAKRVKSSVKCDALILDEKSRSDTYPYNIVNEDDTVLTHEATVGKIGEDQLFYLMSRGLTEEEALNAVVMGFLEPFTKSLPLVYAIELNRLISLEMTGAVG
ncbi:MAG: Fe-S cluster assembly protein SufB [Conexivisphaerales archaeon]